MKYFKLCKFMNHAKNKPFYNCVAVKCIDIGNQFIIPNPIYNDKYDKCDKNSVEEYYIHKKYFYDLANWW